jgi:hypothetical protein
MHVLIAEPSKKTKECIYLLALNQNMGQFRDEGFPLSPNASAELKRLNKLLQAKHVFT